MNKFIFLMTCLLSMSANANLISNGDFSTGDITGWDLSGGEYSQVQDGFFREYDNSGWAILSQDIVTVAGEDYAISFDTKASVVAGNDFAWAIDGVLTGITTTTDWASSFGSFIGTGVTTNIAFYIATTSGSGTWFLDNISVTGPSVSVPAPASIALLGLGLAGFGFSRRKTAA